MFFVAVFLLTLTSLLSATTTASPLDITTHISDTFEDDDDNWQVAVVGGEIQFVQNSDDVEMFSLTNGDRKTMQKAPRHMSYFGSVLDSNSGIAYILGGRTDTDSDKFHAFHVLRNEWEGLTPFPFQTSYNALAVLNDKVYSLGGWSATNNEYVPNAFVYRLNDNQGVDTTDNHDVPGDDSDWSEHAALPATVAGACAVQIGSSIFYMGGRNEPAGSDAYRFATELYRSDDGASSWTQLSSMSVGRAAAACVAVGQDWIMIAGGLTEGLATTDSTEIYQVSSNTWTTKQPMLHKKNGAQAIVLPGTRDVLVCGGDDSGSPIEYFSLCEVYDWDLNEWRLSNDKMRMGRSHFGMFLVHDDDRRRAQSENSQNLTLSVK